MISGKYNTFKSLIVKNNNRLLLQKRAHSYRTAGDPIERVPLIASDCLISIQIFPFMLLYNSREDTFHSLIQLLSREEKQQLMPNKTFCHRR